MSAAKFNTTESVIIYQERNTQYRASTVIVNNEHTYINVCKWTKGDLDFDFRPSKKTIFLPPQAACGLQLGLNQLLGNLPGMCILIIYR
jgi:hypothetical protein